MSGTTLRYKCTLYVVSKSTVVQTNGKDRCTHVNISRSVNGNYVKVSHLSSTVSSMALTKIRKRNYIECVSKSICTLMQCCNDNLCQCIIYVTVYL